MKRIFFLISMILASRCIYSADQCSQHNPCTAVVVHTHLGAGFFAALNTVVDSLLHFENDPAIRAFSVDWTLPLFPFKDDPDCNGWDLFFEPIEWPNTTNNHQDIMHVTQGYHELHDQICSDMWTKYDDHLPYRLAVHAVIRKYLKLRPVIIRTFQELYARHLDTHYCIGVHVRYATTHGLEIPGGAVPELQDYYAQIDALLAQPHDKPIKIYLATDSEIAIQQFTQRYPAQLLAFLPNAHRSSERKDPHLIFENTRYWVENPQVFHAHKPGTHGGYESLIDCLLLSTCDILIHTTSNLSSFATYFNPYIQSIYLPLNVAPNPCRYKYTKQTSNEPIYNTHHAKLP